MRERLKELLAGVLEVPATEIPDDASVENLPDWDSLRQLELMLALELEYGVRISTESMLDLQSLPVIEEFLAEHGTG
jgi:acyl carrier protein